MALPPTNPPGLVRDAEDLNKVINGDGTTNRAGDSLPSIKSIIGVVEARRDTAIGTIDGYVSAVDSERASAIDSISSLQSQTESASTSAIQSIQQAEADTQGALDDAVDRIITEGEQAAASTGWFVIGDFADGFEFTARNQVGRDADGELWSYNGAELPFTVTAGTTPSEPDYTNRGDAALRSGLAAENGYRRVANMMAPNAYGVPGKLTNVTISSVSIRPCGYFDSLLWGRDSSNRLHSSSDMGETWQLVSSAANRTIRQAFRTSDGEVLIQSSTGLSKSSGWPANPATATWSTVLSRPAGNVADFLKWGTDGDGQKFIATHYSSTRADSRYVWISTDAGSTFTQVYDSNENDPVEGPLSHIHAACYDPWDDRFYFTEGHAGIVGVYYSDNDGSSWVKMTTDTVNGETMDPAFTTMKATDFGIVCGTDGPPNGVWLIRRTANPDDVGIEFMGAVTKRQEGVAGFFDHSFRDPDTGIVYLGYGSNFYPDDPHCIMACGAAGASIIYDDAASRVFSVYAAKGKIVAQIGTGVTWLRADTSQGSFYGDYLRAQDRGNVGLADGEFTRVSSLRVGRASAMGLASVVIGHGASDGGGSQRQTVVGRSAIGSSDSSTAIGHQASATNARSVAVGAASSADGAWGVALGFGAGYTGTYGIAIGYQTQAVAGIVIGHGANQGSGSSNSSIAIGTNTECQAGTAVGADAVSRGAFGSAFGGSATATTTGANAFGYAASATGTDSTAVGRSASASSTEATAIGRGASASNAGCTSVGINSEASGLYSAAFGRAASASHQSSVALGNSSSTQRDSSACVGARHIESTLDGGRIYLKSPDGTLHYLRVEDDGTLSVTAV